MVSSLASLDYNKVATIMSNAISGIRENGCDALKEALPIQSSMGKSRSYRGLEKKEIEVLLKRHGIILS